MTKNLFVFVVCLVMLPFFSTAQRTVRRDTIPIVSKKIEESLTSIPPEFKGKMIITGGTSAIRQTAVAWLARKKGWLVQKIDLSIIVSKNAAETERNIASIFDNVSTGTKFLFFDEADALFGKRTSVKDSRDKYANQEVAYLMERLENFNGLVILASNYTNKMDSFFLRKFRYILNVELPKPLH